MFRIPEATQSCDSSTVRGPERIKKTPLRQKDRPNTRKDITSRAHERKKCDSRKRKLELELIDHDQQIKTKKQKKIESYFVKANQGTKTDYSRVSVSTLDSTSEQATSFSCEIDLVLK